MHRRLRSKLMLVAVVALVGCGSSAKRAWPWLRRPATANIAQTSIERDASGVDALSAAPTRLPPGIELPPEPTSPSQTLPSGATESPEAAAAGSVIFASARNGQ